MSGLFPLFNLLTFFMSHASALPPVTAPAAANMVAAAPSSPPSVASHAAAAALASARTLVGGAAWTQGSDWLPSPLALGHPQPLCRAPRREGRHSGHPQPRRPDRGCVSGRLRVGHPKPRPRQPPGLSFRPLGRGHRPLPHLRGSGAAGGGTEARLHVHHPRANLAARGDRLPAGRRSADVGRRQPRWATPSATGWPRCCREMGRLRCPSMRGSTHFCCCPTATSRASPPQVPASFFFAAPPSANLTCWPPRSRAASSRTSIAPEWATPASAPTPQCCSTGWHRPRRRATAWCWWATASAAPWPPACSPACRPRRRRAPAC